MPPAILLLAAHFTGLLSGASAYGVVFVIWVTGVTAIAISGWPIARRWVVGIAYTMLAAFTLPFLTLLAVCTTGDCL